jgi:nucleoside-diphosphate-sugar epimerase
VTEDATADPRGLYEVTKCESDRLVQQAAADGRIEMSILRPAIVFGATMPNRSIAQMIRMIERGWFFFIGGRGASANYVEVSNVVDALVLCGTRREAAGRIYNLSDWCTMEEFVGAICSAAGTSLPRRRLPEAPIRLLARVLGQVPHLPLTESRVDALVNRSRYAIDRIERELGYRHRVSIAEGLRRLVVAESTR